MTISQASIEALQAGQGDKLKQNLALACRAPEVSKVKNKVEVPLAATDPDGYCCRALKSSSESSGLEASFGIDRAHRSTLEDLPRAQRLRLQGSTPPLPGAYWRGPCTPKAQPPRRKGGTLFWW